MKHHIGIIARRLLISVGFLITFNSGYSEDVLYATDNAYVGMENTGTYFSARKLYKCSAITRIARQRDICISLTCDSLTDAAASPVRSIKPTDPKYAPFREGELWKYIDHGTSFTINMIAPDSIPDERILEWFRPYNVHPDIKKDSIYNYQYNGNAITLMVE